MKALVRALILAGLPLFVLPFVAHASSHTGTLPVLGNCYDLKVIPSDMIATSAMRQYVFEGMCVVYDGLNTPRPSTITVKYDIATHTASETLKFPSYLPGPSVAGPVHWQCSNDPWLVPGASCDIKPGGNGPNGIYEHCWPGNFYVAYCKGQPPPGSPTGPFPWDQPLHAPLTKPGFNAVKAHVNTLLAQTVAPKILKPSEGQAYPPGDLTIGAAYDPPDLSNWLYEYKYPPGASTVIFEWRRLHVNPGGQGGSWVTEDFLPSLNLDGLSPTVDTRFKEGWWRVQARHNLPAWPWTMPLLNFWIGDKVDYTKPVATIQDPTEYEMHVTDNGSGLYQVDFLIAYQGAQSSKQAPSAQAPAVQAGQPGGAAKFEVEIQLDWYQKTAIGGKTGFGVMNPVIFKSTANLPFTQHLNKGAWRVRARSSALTAGGLHYPWTEWRLFNAGLPVDENGNLVWLTPPSQSQNSSSQRLDPETAKKVLKALGNDGARQLNPESAKALVQALGDDGMRDVDPNTARTLSAAAQGDGNRIASTQGATPDVPKAGTGALAPLSGPVVLKVTGIRTMSRPVAGQPVEIQVALQNDSDKPIQTALQELKISCGATPGRNCAIVSPVRSEPFSLQPRQTRTLKIVVQPSARGSYVVSVVPHNAPASRGQSLSLAVVQAPAASNVLPSMPQPRASPDSAPEPSAGARESPTPTPGAILKPRVTAPSN